MFNSKKLVVMIGLFTGSLAVGVAAAAFEGADEPPEVPETSTTTTVVDTSTTSSTVPDTTSTTTEATTTTEAPSTTVAPSTSVTPPTTEAPDETNAEGGEPGAHGLCNAFAGREQPGNSQGWQRLHDAANGDIDGYCATVMAEQAAARANASADNADTDDE